MYTSEFVSCSVISVMFVDESDSIPVLHIT